MVFIMMSLEKWLFCSLSSFSSHYVPVPIDLRIFQLPRARTSISTENRRKMWGFQYSRRVCNRRFIYCSQQNVGESGYSISSWWSSSGYLASMLTEGAQVDLSSTCQLWAPSVNISAEYPALLDHDSMNNPSVYTLLYDDLFELV